MTLATIFKIVGEGALLLHVTAVWPLWFELSLKMDKDYPLERNIVAIIVIISLPYLVCLLLSHSLYRLTDTNAPFISCVLSVAMSALTLHFCSAAYNPNAGEKSIILIPIIIIQNLIGMALFAALRSGYRKKRFKDW